MRQQKGPRVNPGPDECSVPAPAYQYKRVARFSRFSGSGYRLFVRAFVVLMVSNVARHGAPALLLTYYASRDLPLC